MPDEAEDVSAGVNRRRIHHCSRDLFFNGHPASSGRFEQGEGQTAADLACLGNQSLYQRAGFQ